MISLVPKSLGEYLGGDVIELALVNRHGLRKGEADIAPNPIFFLAGIRLALAIRSVQVYGLQPITLHRAEGAIHNQTVRYCFELCQSDVLANPRAHLRNGRASRGGQIKTRDPPWINAPVANAFGFRHHPLGRQGRFDINALDHVPVLARTGRLRSPNGSALCPKEDPVFSVSFSGDVASRCQRRFSGTSSPRRHAQSASWS